MALFYFQQGQLVIWCQGYFAKLDGKAMGAFVIWKVTGLYGQWVTIEDLDRPSGYSRWAHPLSFM